MKANPVLTLLSLYPYFTLFFYWLWVVIAAISLGHMPQRDDPFPDWAFPVSTAAEVSFVMLPWTMVLGVTALFLCFVRSTRPTAFKWSIRYWLGVVFWFVHLYYDPGGAVDWFLD